MAVWQDPEEQEISGTKVRCSFSDCIYHSPDPLGSTMAVCGHPDKKHNMNKKKCVLYRMDWQKKMERFNSGG